MWPPHGGVEVGPEQDDLLRPRLVDIIDMRHEMVIIQTHKIRHIAIPSLMLKVRMTPITSSYMKGPLS